MQYLLNTITLAGTAASDTPKISYSDNGYASIAFSLCHKTYRREKLADGTYKNAEPLWMWVRITSKMNDGRTSLAERIIGSYKKGMRLAVTGELQYYMSNDQQRPQIDVHVIQELDLPAQANEGPAPVVQQTLPPVQYHQPAPAPVVAQQQQTVPGGFGPPYDGIPF